MYKRGLNGWLKHLDFVLLDLVTIQICLLAAFQMRNRISFADLNGLYKTTALCIGMLDLLVMFFNESYKGILKRGYLKELKAVIKHMTYLNVLLLIYLYMMKMSGLFSRIIFFGMWILEIFFGWILRCIWKTYLVRKKKEQTMRSVIVVTTYRNASPCIHSLMIKEYADYKITGLCIVDQDCTGEEICDIPVVAGAGDVLEYIRMNWVDGVFLRIPENTEERYQECAEQIHAGCIRMGIPVHTALAHRPSMESGSQMIEHMGDYTVLTSSMHTVTNRQGFLKRMLDIAGGLAGSLITVILTLFIAPLIYLESPGPVFFSQERIGKNGKRFKMYKFRSMYLDAEQRKKDLMEQSRIQDGMMFKMEDDPRIICRKGKKRGIGHFIRETSIDEFPQFFNVLKGDMSLVGTRPPTVDEWERYQLHHRARLSVKPGITGLWQVSGRSSITDFEEVVELDTEYIQNWTIGMDIKILLKTVEVVLKRDGTM